MTDNMSLVDKYESNLYEIVYNMVNDNISADTIRYILKEISSNLELMDFCEEWAKDTYV